MWKSHGHRYQHVGLRHFSYVDDDGITKHHWPYSIHPQVENTTKNRHRTRQYGHAGAGTQHPAGQSLEIQMCAFEWKQIVAMNRRERRVLLRLQIKSPGSIGGEISLSRRSTVAPWDSSQR